MNNQKPNTRAFRATMGALLILTLVVFAADSMLGSGIVNKSGVSLTTQNLAGISSMLQNIVPSITIGVITLLIAMLVIGKLLGQNWRENVKAIVDNNNNDSTFALAEKIAIATTFVAMSVPSATWFIWLAVFAAKLVVMLTVSILITTALSMLIMSVVKDPDYHEEKDRAEVTVAVSENLTLESGYITIAVVFDTATLTGGRIGVLHVLKGTEVIRGDVSVGETKVYESEGDFLAYAKEVGKLKLK